MASGDNQTLSPTKQALLALRDLQAKLRVLEEARNEPVAIIGIGCRYPGLEGVEAFWKGLCRGADAVGDVPADRWNADRLYDPSGATPGTMISRQGGFLPNLDEFDAAFFGISPREAPHVDPRQRLMLEVAWEALETAGIPPDSLAGSRTGVFVSTLTNDYDHLLFSDLRRADAYSGAGTANSIVANRISYFLGLHGPSIALDTACSGSLVAIHLACESLRRGESTMALAGGVNVNLMAKSNVFFSKAGALSPHGRCSTFDRDADGMVRSDGAGLIVLKLLSQAQRDGDPIVAILRGSAVNHDGRSNGIMAPNGEAQRRVLAEAYRKAGVAPGDVQMIEAHGTGTRLGDPIEVQALGDVLTEGRPAGKRCALGSVKTNFGHTEAAAGIAGVIKASLALQHRQIPASLHFQNPNPLIPFDRLPFFVPRELTPWPSPNETLIAGVSGFGFGGTNAHIVLQEAPPPAHDSAERSGTCLLPLSARTPNALRILASAWLEFLPHEEGSLGDLARTAAVHRTHFPCRMAVMADTLAELRANIEQRLSAMASHEPLGEDADAPGGTVFVFSGQGSHWPRMGMRLFEQEPIFRRKLEECDQWLRDHVAWSLLDELRREENGSRIDDTEIAQPAIFSMQVALAELWRSWGIHPDAVVGHSLGEVTAAHAAGALSLADAIRVVVHRSRLMKRAAGKGRTAVVGLPVEETQRRLRRFEGRIAIAGSNSSSASVISGDADAVEAFVRQAEMDGVFSRLITGVDIAFHSQHMDPLRDELVRALEGICPQAERIQIFSTVTADAIQGSELHAGYWGRNLRDPFLFAQTMARLLDRGYGTFLEVSPHAVLSSAMLQTVRERGDGKTTILSSLRRKEDEKSALLAALGRLYELGHTVTWSALYGERGRRITLPSYPWQRQRSWYDQLGGGGAEWDERSFSHGHPLLGAPFEPALPIATGTKPVSAHGWEMEIDATHPGYLTDHRILGEAVLPGSACLEMARQAGREVLPEGTVVVSDLTFENALKLPDGTARRVQVLLTGDEDERSFLLFSRNAASRSAWTRHASGAVTVEPVREYPRIDLDALRAHCRDEASPETHYERMRAGGLEYGPGFRVIRQIWQGENEALARIQLATGAEDSRYGMHPILLDASLQIAAAAFPEARSDQPERYLPHAVRQWRLLQSPGDRVWCHAVMRESSGTEFLEADLTLVDEQGQVVAVLDGLVLKRVRSSRGVSIRESLLTEAWQECPRSPASNGLRNWLILADQGGIGASVAEQLRSQGCAVALAHRGDQFQQVDASTFIVRDDRTDDLRALLDMVAPAFDGVVHLWTLDTPEPQHGSLLEAQRLGCGSALLLAQAMLAVSCFARLWLVTRGAQPVRQEPLHLAQAPLAGFGLILGQEHPELQCSCIDLDASDKSSSVTGLVAELLHAGSDQRVAWRQATRYAARLQRATLQESVEELKLYPDATYLVTGGLGALGLRTAAMLVERGARHLVLTGRRGAEGKQASLQPLLDAGADVRVIRADLARPEDVRRLLQQIGEEMPPLRGVIHSAGVLDDGLVRQQTFSRFEMVMVPKVVGAWNLHQQTQNLPLDFFVLFSSAASMVGSAGQSNYAAANAFLDALAHHRRALGLPAVSINWGAWRDDGMAAREQTLTRMAARGVASIDPSEGLELLAMLLQPEMKVARIGVFPVDWTRFLQQFTGEVPSLFRDLGGAPSAATNPFRRQWESAPVAARDGLLRSYLRETLAAVMGFGASPAIQARQGFFDLGMDSLTALEFRNRLEAGIGVGLPSTLVFDYPNLEALGAFVKELLAANASTPQKEIGGSSSSQASHTENLDDLTDDELARLLEFELDEGGR